MKNMSPEVTRPVNIITKTVDQPKRQGAFMPSNLGPNPYVPSSPAESPLGDGVVDRIIAPTRTTYNEE